MFMAAVVFQVMELVVPELYPSHVCSSFSTVSKSIRLSVVKINPCKGHGKA
jgi:hypothetical protein